MTSNRILRRLAFFVLAAPLVAQAAIITSVNRATFQSAVASQQIDQQNFDSLAAGTILGSLGGVTYSSSLGSPLVTSTFLTSTSPNGLGRTGVGFFLPTDTATFVFSTAITAFAIDINTFANQLGDYVATLNTGDVVTSLNEVFPGQGTGQFIGFTSNQAFSSLTISANQLSSSPNRTYTLDTLVFGSAAAVQRVPEPHTLSLLLLALMMAALPKAISRVQGRRS